jgi:hypothetical protein
MRDSKATFWLWERAHLAFPIAAAVAVLACHLPILRAVLETNGDNVYHLLSEYAIGHSVAAGDSIWGPQSTDFGMPLLRFYQPLFYLVNVGLHVATGASPFLFHNLSVSLFFAASPLAYCWGLRKIGLPRFAAGLASLLAMTSVAGFGNSFEAYHSNGIVTQAMGAFFFPLFIGAFVGLLRGENRVTSTALLFAATFLSHVIMAVLAAFACTLYFLVNAVPVRAVWRRVAAMGALVTCLVAFWLFPFLAHTMEMRAIPDTDARGTEKRWWFVGASDDEMVKLATSGRLLDDARAVGTKGQDPLDGLIDKLNISKTRFVRPPVVTVLTAWGLVVALLLLRRSSIRFLVSGLLFSLLLYAGQDDHPWLRFFPFIDHVQSFRCTYFVEFFAFALIGLGIERPVTLLLRAAGGSRRGVLRAAIVAALAIVVLPSGWAFFQIAKLGPPLVTPSELKPLDDLTAAAKSAPGRGYPFRIQTLEKRRGMLLNWLGINGYRLGITHWGGVGPTSMLKLQFFLKAHVNAVDLWSLAGVRYLQGSKKEAAPILEKGADAPWLAIGNAAGQTVFDSGRDELLHVANNPLVLVRCRHSQWIRLVDSWITRYGASVDDPKTPFPVRLRGEEWDRSAVVARAAAVLYLDGDASAEERDRIGALAARGKRVWIPFEIAGIAAEVLPRHRSLWQSIGRKVVVAAAAEAAAERHDDPRRSNQRFAFDVDALEPALAVLPTSAIPGWTAALDGERTEVFSAGPDLVAVVLPRGAHRLAFAWEMPGTDRFFTILSAVAAALVFAAWLASALAALALRRSSLRAHGAGRRA